MNVKANRSTILETAFRFCLLVVCCASLSVSAIADVTIHSIDYPDKISTGLQRPDMMSLDGEWKFQTDPSDVGKTEQWFEGGKIDEYNVSVPLPWELTHEELRDYSGIAWYERQFTIPGSFRGKRIRLCFDGVAHHVQVYLNGEYIAEHFGAQTPFSLDITHVAKPGKTNILTVRCWNPRTGIAWYMDSHSLLKVSGLWRGVWVEPAGKDFISDLFMIPDIDRMRVTATTTVCVPEDSQGKSLRLEIEIEGPAGRQYKKSTRVRTEESTKPSFHTTEIPIEIPNARLWSVDEPNLYSVRARLVEGDETIDTVSDHFGMRKIETHDGRIWLNNEVIYWVGGGIDPLPYGGSGDVNWFLPGPYSYPGDAEIREDIRKIKSLNVNVVRIPLRPMHPQWMRLADEEGLLVWQEASWTTSFGDDLQAWKDNWSELLLRDRNHPSAALWVLFNESWGYQFADPIYEHVKGLDPTRLIIDNTGGHTLNSPNYYGNHGETDIEDVHRYAPFNQFHRDYFLSLRMVEHPLLISEFGAMPYMFNLGRFQEAWGGDPWWVHAKRLAQEQGMVGPWEHRGYEDRYYQWGMDELYGDWGAFMQAHDWYHYWGLKCQTEWMRMNNETSGFIAWIWDNGQHGTGVIDNFKDVKIFGPKLAKSWTQDLVIIDKTRHNYWGGQNAYANIHVSHFGNTDLEGAMIEWRVEGTDIKGRIPCAPIERGVSRQMGEIVFEVPDVSEPREVVLTAQLIDMQGRTISENMEPLWFYPQSECEAVAIPIGMAGPQSNWGFAYPNRLFGYNHVPLEQNPSVVLTSRMEQAVLDYLREGGTVLYFPTGQEEFLTHNGLNLSSQLLGGHTDMFYAKKGLGIFDRIPFENPVTWEFRKIWPNLVIFGMKSEQREDILSGAYMNLLNRQCATTAQFRAGKGRIIVSTLNLINTVQEDPAAVLIFNDLLKYASGDFQPGSELKWVDGE